MKNQKTILLLDGNALLHRAWHAIPPLTTKDGLVVNAAYGFTMIVEKMIQMQKPEYMVVAWDVEGGTFRNEIFSDYKGHRVKKEQELYDQIPMIQEILKAFGIPSIEVPGFEADDIIGTLANMANKEGLRALIVTGDLDSLQLVNENTQVLTFKKGISVTKLYDIEAVKERYGLTPDQLIDYKALRGDPSDNIPGLAGVGEKTAILLLQRHETIKGILENIDIIEEKYAKKIRGKEDVIELSLKLVEIVQDMKLEFDFASSKLGEPDKVKLMELYRKLEFRMLIQKHGGNEVPPPPKMEMVNVGEKKTETKAEPQVKIQVVKDLDLAEEQLSNASVLSVMIAQQPPDLFGATLAAIALSDGVQTFVIPNPSKEILDRTTQLLLKTREIISHDLKGLMHQIDTALPGLSFDVMIASYLLASGSRTHDLIGSIHTWLGRTVVELPTTFSKEKDYERFGQMVSLLPELAKKMSVDLKETGVEKVFRDIEMPLVSVLYKMEIQGIELDIQNLASFSEVLKMRLNKLTKQIVDLAGVEFNLNSPSQLAVVLFQTLDLPVKGIKKTKTGYSTAAPELEKLWNEHEIIPLISEYRELSKLQSTYVEALPKLVAKDGRIHTSFNQTVAATGRLSSSEPNLQNIPVKTELGREIRKAFVVPRGKVLVAADYSQIELRLAAVIAKDKPFISAFQAGADIHTRTAAEVWDVAEEAVTKEQRQAAKAINFGVLYGMGPRALSKSTGFSMAEAKDFIERYFKIHSAIREYLDETKLKAHTDGYVETVFGRRRYLPEIESGVPMLVASAERMAINMPIQGAAADIMKMAMLRVDGWLAKSEWPAKMLLQVHDEIILEVDKEAVEPVVQGIKEMMESVTDFEVPLMVEVEVGKNWGELK